MDKSESSNAPAESEAWEELNTGYDARIDEIRDMAHTLAAILMKPAVNSALKRNETRQSAHAALASCINAMADMCACANSYAEAISAFEKVRAANAPEAAAEPPKNK